MADEVDLANDIALAAVERALAQKKAPKRNPAFCDCPSWAAGCNFCGKVECRDDYEAQERLVARRIGTRVRRIELHRAAR